MLSMYDAVLATLSDATFTIPNVTIRKPFDESPKVYPFIVLHEVVNLPKSHATTTGEAQTALAYQLDIHTKAVVDDDDAVLDKWSAGERLVAEVTDLLDASYKLTRRSVRTSAPAPDVVLNIWRGECVLDSQGYSYRR